MPQFILELSQLAVLGTVSFYFCGIVLAISLVAAVLLQGGHEVLRMLVNKWAVSAWLNTRAYSLPLNEILKQMPAIGSGLFWLPYWQLTGQIGAAVGSQLNLDQRSTLILVLANVPDFDSFDSALRKQLGAEASADTIILRELTARTQVGINSLHTHLRNYWNIFDYAVSLLLVLVIGGLLTTVTATQGQRFVLYTICAFAWFATPILRRMIERLVPFR